ncbi:uncharacterized protein LOC107483576 [Arachis duranensis]|uniref:Uncharacterized protein LOC107483576 n=1 Tax=Arachis duranensis TaxID=130453 RepID=A0A9C6TT23_ARADU|nr:uncharacterized protein LOC107483576 [Arachis duranensis]
MTADGAGTADTPIRAYSAAINGSRSVAQKLQVVQVFVSLFFNFGLIFEIGYVQCDSVEFIQLKIETRVQSAGLLGKYFVVLLSHSSASGEESDEKQSFSSKNKFSSRNASSKYDFVKVKVRLGDNADHYYVLSRFSLSRCGWMIMLQCGFDLENGQCWFIWNSFVRNWKFEPSPNIVTTEQSVIWSYRG